MHQVNESTLLDGIVGHTTICDQTGVFTQIIQAILINVIPICHHYLTYYIDTYGCVIEYSI